MYQCTSELVVEISVALNRHISTSVRLANLRAAELAGRLVAAEKRLAVSLCSKFFHRFYLGAAGKPSGGGTGGGGGKAAPGTSVYFAPSGGSGAAGGAPGATS